MKITKVEIVLIKPNRGLIGFANIILEEQLFIGSIGIHLKRNGKGCRLTYPNRKVGELNVTVFHPIKPELSKTIEEAVETHVLRLLNF